MGDIGDVNPIGCAGQDMKQRVSRLSTLNYRTRGGVSGCRVGFDNLRDRTIDDEEFRGVHRLEIGVGHESRDA